MLYTVFGNPASKQLNDPVWGGTTKQFQNHLAVARYFNEEMGVATETLATLRGVIGNVTPTIQQAFDSFLGIGKQKLLEASGYKMLGAVMINRNGVETPGIKAQKRDGSFIVILKDGSEVPFTSAVAAQTRTVDSVTGLTTGQTAGIAVGVIALAALFFFMSKRR